MKYDAVVVGASIAGLSCGIRLARAGWRVCIADRRREIGVPVRCGEATGTRQELARFVDVNESWIAGNIDGLTVHAGTDFVHAIKIQNAGVMLHRDRFEKAMAKTAESLGADIRLDTPVTGLIPGRDKKSWAGVMCEGNTPIEATHIIDASGVESCVGRWAGITKNLALDEIASSIQYRIQSDFCNDGALHFFIGEKTIPCGYIWVFPKTQHDVLVGGCIYRTRGVVEKVKHYVDRFIALNIPGAAQYEATVITGGIPVTLPPKTLVRENVTLIGDSARQVNPLTAGGIMNTLEAADQAADYLIRRQKESPRTVVDSYSKSWRRKQRRQQVFFLLAREIWFSTPDRDLVKRIKTVCSLAKNIPDRSQPFKLPLVAAVRFLLYVFPLTVKHIRILFR